MDPNLEYVLELLKHYQASHVDPTISPTDPMNNQWYLDVGRYAVETMVAACVSARIRDVKTVLDLPCGHGRVLRHLVHFFPTAEFYACDLDKEGVDFCASHFAAHPVYSKPDLTELDFGTKFDVIWVGSLFTHVPRNVACSWARHLASLLTETGIVVATFHGRWSECVHGIAPFIDDTLWREILDDYDACGYGYRDYPPSAGQPYMSATYGVSLVKPHIAVHDIEDIPGVRIHLYRERGWADNHDVIVFGPPAHDKLWKVTSQESVDFSRRRGRAPEEAQAAL
jgi:SAM-dependent methyltransferase